MRRKGLHRFPAYPLSLIWSILNWVNMFHVLSLLLGDNNCRIHSGFWGFFFQNIWWCFASPLTPWLKPTAPTVTLMPQKAWFPYVFFSMYNRKKDEKVLTSNRSDISLSLHICEHEHTHTQSPEGSWLWSASCGVYEVQAAPVPLRSNKEAIKMFTDSTVQQQLCARR